MQAVVMYGGGGGVKGSINTKSLAVGFGALKSQKQHYTSSLDFSNRNSQLSSSSSSSFGLRLNSLSSSSMATELTRSSLFHSRPVLKALASDGGDVEEVRPIKSEDDVTYAVPVPQQQGKASVLPFVGVACLGAILFGYHLGVVNGALEYLAKDLGIVENTVLQGKELLFVYSFINGILFVVSLRAPCFAGRLLEFNSRKQRMPFAKLVKQRCFGWIVSTLLAGATVGSFTGGALADKFGRTRTFQLDAIPLTIGAVLCATAQSVQTMIIGRLLAGIGIGISSAIVPLYISEISPTEIRGALGSVNQLFICIGILLALVAGLPLAGNPIWWRTMFGISAVPAVLLALGMAFSPESPRWLFQQGKFSEAEKSIKTLYGKERVADAMTDLNVASQGSAEQEAGWFDLFSSRYWKVVSVGVALFFFQQMAGINAVVYYSTAVFRSAGIESDVAASALVGASNVFGTTIASSLMDRQGRKSLLITSFFGMAASMLLLSLSFTWKALAPYSGTLAVLGTVCYVLSFSLGAGPVPALLLPEIFASRIRAKAVALSLGMHWAANFVIGLYFLSFVNKFGISSVYLGFSGICLLGVLYIAANVVETKGRSLEEIERALDPAI
ncbi:hypothetical protein NC653_038489 [Populus alba x Populus x berolinensis]|uniref:Major facilitator superfamily (MFS) profile domain-containing protein n=1 Tax=Populus alba x Populus x berolinensis TaxID=444605 RepID=A0AAD6LH44_9ROSI|nr:hypothetical protein NC653_038489 [Populus alba x Populus x berolinensis]